MKLRLPRKPLPYIISTIGNPMVIALFYGIYVQYLAQGQAGYQYLPLIFALGVVGPVFGFIFWKVRQNEYADYDVSNRVKRQGLYWFLIPVLGLLALILVGFRFPFKVILPVFAFLLQIVFSAILNRKFKVSMHTSFCFLFSYLFFPLNVPISIVLFCFGFLVAWSRIELNRHSPKEVLVGILLGNFVGLVYMGFINAFVAI